MKIVFDENYGHISYAQRAAYRKYNVSPSDHDELLQVFGNDPAAITKYVKFNASNHRGMFSVYEMSQDSFFGIC